MSTTNFAGALANLVGRLWPGRPRAPTVRQLPVLVIVEGRHDIEFLKRISGVLATHRSDLLDLTPLEQAGKLVFIPAGGDFVPWLHRLAGFGCAEIHLYDREVPPVTQQRLAGAAAVNCRPNCRAFVTQYRSLENYLHPDAIREARGLDLVFSDQDDVAAIASQASLELHSAAAWDSLSRRARQRLRNRAKAWLNTAAAERMTPERIAERDPAGEIPLWLATIGRFVAER
jgi:putative ATP-dependent endonuclease of OLD family